MVRYVDSSPTDQLQPKTFERFYAKPGDTLEQQERVLLDVEGKREFVIESDAVPECLRAIAEWPGARTAARSRSSTTNAAIRPCASSKSTATTGDGARADRRALQHVHPLQRRERQPDGCRPHVPAGPERRRGDHLDVRARRLGASVPVRRPHRPREEPDHVRQVGGAVGGARGRSRRVRSPSWRAASCRARIRTSRSSTASTSTARDSRRSRPRTAITPCASRRTTGTTWTRWSRVDLAPVSQLRAAADGKVLMDLETGDLAPLTAAGWRAPEAFVAKGRDGTTDIYGIIIRPTNFDPARKYPVIENIYAGPHGSFVPKSFTAYYGMQALAELGFIVVQIDGMGTANRSRAFHDVAWKNLADAGFPGSHPLASGGREEVPVVRHHARRHLWRLGRRPELAGRHAVPFGVLQSRGLVCRLPRQSHGQDLVERTVDGLADRAAVRRVVEYRTRRRT